MNWVDVGIVVLVGWNVFGSLWTGFIREVFAIIGFVAGVYLAGRFAPLGANIFFFVPSSEIATIIAFVFIFLAIVTLVRFVAGFVQQTAQLLMLGWFDQAGGALVGFAKGVLISEVLLIVVANMQIMGLAAGVKESRIAAILLGFLPSLLVFLPKELQAVQSLFNR